MMLYASVAVLVVMISNRYAEVLEKSFMLVEVIDLWLKFAKQFQIEQGKAWDDLLKCIGMALANGEVEKYLYADAELCLVGFWICFQA